MMKIVKQLGMYENNPFCRWHWPSFFTPLLVEYETVLNGTGQIWCVRIFGFRVALIASGRQ